MCMPNDLGILILKRETLLLMISHSYPGVQCISEFSLHFGQGKYSMSTHSGRMNFRFVNRGWDQWAGLGDFQACMMQERVS